MERGAELLRAADRPWDAKIMEGPGVMSLVGAGVLIIAAAAVPLLLLLLLALGRDDACDGAAIEIDVDDGRWAARDDFELVFEDLLDDPPLPPKRASRLDAASFL